MKSSVRPNGLQIERGIWNCNPVNIQQLTVPTKILEALSRKNGSYTRFKTVFHCIWLGDDNYIGVTGDGANACYEYFEWNAGSLTCSDAGFGDSTDALKNILSTIP